jgi:hypothetical protein
MITLKKKLESKFEIIMGEATFYLEMEINREYGKKNKVNQKDYISRVLSGMEDCNEVKSPLEIGFKLVRGN